jgi:hypothetical protein
MIKESSKQKQIKGAKKSAKIQKYKKQMRIKEYNSNPKLCKTCNCSLSYDKRNNKFCDHSCSSSFNNLGIVRHGSCRKKECFNCGKITKNVKYCSSVCHKEFEWSKVKKRIDQTMIALTHLEGKKYLLKTEGNKCKICNIDEWNDKKLIMILDHINGDSIDNSISNLRLICPNCDSQTLTYKGRNKGNGRYYRRKRYAEGKSY